MDVSSVVNRMLAERPAADFLRFSYDGAAIRISDAIFKSTGITASYLIVAGAERVIVNTGTGPEAVHHRRLFDAVSTRPTRYIITTQAHTDHVGGVSRFRDPGTQYVAQANNAECQRIDQQLSGLRRRFGAPWFSEIRSSAQDLAKRYPDGVSPLSGDTERPDLGPLQDQPKPDIVFSDSLLLRAGDLEFELLATPGGETTDSCIVWLPEHRTCFISNLLGPLFPHFPNFNTLRGDRYRDPQAYLASLQTLRGLHPEMLLTGRGSPVVGGAEIDAVLGRLYDAVEYVFVETCRGINAGKDVATLMREVVLPERLHVGQAYGRVAWGVRAIWESYVGWFQQRSTAELYPSVLSEVQADIVDMAGADALAEQARKRLAAGEPLVAIGLLETVLEHDPVNHSAASAMVDAHRMLLDEGGQDNFWLKGWLGQQIARWSAVGDETGDSDECGS